MKAIVVRDNGGPEVLQLEDRPDPEPGRGEVLVRVSHAGVNFADVVMRQGPTESMIPFVPGVEGAGEVIGLGEGVTSAAVGDRVAWSPVRQASKIGSYAELAVVGTEQLLPVPDDISLETAAAVALQGLTAHYLATDIVTIAPGTAVLVHAGAGGTGRTVVQWVRHLGGTVIATVGTDAKAAVASAAGADHTIVYTKVDFVEEVWRLTEGRGVDYIVDGVGSTFRADLRAVADRGSICVFGRSGGFPDPVSPLSLTGRSISVVGGYMTNYLRDRDEVLRKAADLWRGVTEGWLSPLVHSILPLAQAADAHRLLEGRETVGKLVLRVGGDDNGST